MASHPCRITEDELIEDLRKVATLLGRGAISQPEYITHGRYGLNTLRRRLGPWPVSLQRAGLGPPPYRVGIPGDELLDDLRRVVREGHRPTQLRYRRHGRFSLGPFFRVYGSWFGVLDAAGLPRTRQVGVSREEYLDNLEAVWRALGRMPRRTDMKKPLSRYCATAYEYRFGSWRAVIAQFAGELRARGLDVGEDCVTTEGRDLTSVCSRRHGAVTPSAERSTRRAGAGRG